MQTGSMLITEVGAAISVLLGFAPPSTLSAASSSKVGRVVIDLWKSLLATYVSLLIKDLL